MQIALAGNPNVGKSTIFNALTNLHQHTGNWQGKTVGAAMGSFVYKDASCTLVDLPGTYSLSPHSQEEALARDFIASGQVAGTIVVCDASCLERNLILALQILAISPKVLLCLNLWDEARRRGISIDCETLSRTLGIPVVAISAQEKKDIDRLSQAIRQWLKAPTAPSPFYGQPQAEDYTVLTARLVHLAQDIADQVVSVGEDKIGRRDRAIDRILTSRLTGIPIMLALLALIFWITISLANYPSQWLSAGFAWVEGQLTALFALLGAPGWLHGLLVLGGFRVMGWVVSVMLPPMAIFFPLFTILEDLGYLPRVAFNLDKQFKKAHTCGKQALTMCMGLGCNAVGVTGCRIIDSPREQLIAILTNNFIPCNGRFPSMISVISLFLAGTALSALTGSLVLTAVILLGIFMTFLTSRLLSATVLKGLPSSFTLELPPYRKPRLGSILVRSLLDRTLFVLGRAITVAAPAGMVLWLLANFQVAGAPILQHVAGFLDPFARLMGLDGVILLAFILGMPANEIVLPIAVMGYTAAGTLTDIGNTALLQTILLQNGWTWLTGLNVVLFFLIHWPCSTTLITIYKETKSPKWTALAFLLPTLCGIAACLITNGLAHVLGLV